MEREGSLSMFIDNPSILTGIWRVREMFSANEFVVRGSIYIYDIQQDISKGMFDPLFSFNPLNVESKIFMDTFINADSDCKVVLLSQYFPNYGYHMLVDLISVVVGDNGKLKGSLCPDLVAENDLKPFYKETLGLPFHLVVKNEK